MKSLEISAKTVEEAIQHALEKLGVSREEVEVTVVKEGRPGVFGLGAEEAEIRVRPLVPAAKKENDIAETAKGILEALLGLIGVDASVVPQAKSFIEEETTTSIVFDIRGDDLGILIGRRGQTLSCLEYIVRLMVVHQTGSWVPLIIDVEGYRQRRYQALRALAYRMAEQVVVRGTPFALEPMSAYERRIIHLALADHSDVTTESTGQDEVRKVVILPKAK